MGRPVSKSELISLANENYNKLNEYILKMTDKELSTEFDFSNLNKSEAHWSRDKNLRDVLIHLYEWQNLLLNWISNNTKGIMKSFIPLPYNFKTYGQMNLEFWSKHQNTTLDEAKRLLDNSHNAVMKILEGFSNEELFNRNVYKWVGGSTMGSYFISVTSSHYDWALKKLKYHVKNCKGE